MKLRELTISMRMCSGNSGIGAVLQDDNLETDNLVHPAYKFTNICVQIQIWPKH